MIYHFSAYLYRSPFGNYSFTAHGASLGGCRIQRSAFRSLTTYQDFFIKLREACLIYTSIIKEFLPPAFAFRFSSFELQHKEQALADCRVFSLQKLFNDQEVVGIFGFSFIKNPNQFFLRV